MNPLQRGALAALLVGGLGFLAWQNGTFDRLSLDRFDAIFFGVLLPSIVLHEVSHGWVALSFGDDTAKRAGRLTFNPIAHIDPFWTIILPAILIFSGAPPIGMAKPVPISPGRMRDPRNHGMFTALAGPGVNIALAVLAGLGLIVVGVSDSLVTDVLFGVGIINIRLAAFNLIPLPPLDGSSVVERFLPERWLVPYLRFRQYSFIVLIGIFLLADDLFERVVSPVEDLWIRLVI